MFCFDCGKEINEHEAFLIEDTGYFVCIDCIPKYHHCDECHCLCMNTTHINTNLGHIELCNVCMEWHYHRCPECGIYYKMHDVEYINGEYLCHNCAEIIKSKNIISEYHENKPQLCFFGDSKNNSVPYLGIELEIESKRFMEERHLNECAVEIRSIFPDDFIYFEHDGSLENGFENITQPATLDYHYNLKNVYKEAFKILTREGFISHNTSTCGLHVHFNRNFFGDQEDFCVLKLLYLVEKFWNNLEKFSRRSLYSIERWCKKSYDTPEEKLRKSKEGNANRYETVNLTNKNTIEFRIFRGTLKLNTFIATLQLCNNLIMLSKNTKDLVQLQEIKWDDLINTQELITYWNEVKDRVVQ